MRVINTSETDWIIDTCQNFSTEKKQKKCDDYVSLEAMSKEAVFFIVYCLATLVGLINNACSTMVFYQKKYRYKVFAKPMIYFYVNSLIVALLSFFLIVDELLHSASRTDRDSRRGQLDYKIIYFLLDSFMLISHGILSLRAIIRFVYSRNHLIAMGRKGQCLLKCIYTAMALLFSTCVGFKVVSLVRHDMFHDDQEKAVFFLVLTFIHVLFNTAAVVTQHRRPRYSYECAPLVSQTLFSYIIIATSLTLITALPYSIIVLMKFSLIPNQTVGCEFCEKFLTAHIWLRELLKWNYFWDNIVYCALSADYRLDIKRIVQKSLICRILGNKRPSHMASTSKSTNSYVTHGIIDRKENETPLGAGSVCRQSNQDG